MSSSRGFDCEQVGGGGAKKLKPARTCGCDAKGPHKDKCSEADPKRRAAHEGLSATKKQRKDYLSEADSRRRAAKPARVQRTYRIVGPAPRNGETTAERSARIRAEAGDRLLISGCACQPRGISKLKCAVLSLHRPCVDPASLRAAPRAEAQAVWHARLRMPFNKKAGPTPAGSYVESASTESGCPSVALLIIGATRDLMYSTTTDILLLQRFMPQCRVRCVIT